MSQNALLSPLTTEDIPLLEELEAATQLAFWGRENYCRFLQDCPEYFGAKAVLSSNPSGGKLTGFVFSRSIFENLEILKLGVFPKFHRRGIGTLLMEYAYREGVLRGCRRCFLEVRKSNDVAIEFYLGQQFRISGARIKYYTDPVEDAWVMERVL